MPTAQAQILYGGLLFFALCIAWPMAHILGKRWKANHPNKRPYQWGYYWSIMNIAALALVPAAFFGDWRDGAVIGVWMLAGGITGFFTWKRHRWAWILGTLLSFNFVAWVVNGIYLKNRWTEMAGDGAATQTASCSGHELTESEVYLSDNGHQFGPLALAQVRQMQAMGTVGQHAFVCPVGATEWIPVAAYKGSAVSIAPEKPMDFWATLKQRVSENFRPSKSMNYRVFIPSLVLALLAGALLHAWLGSRYRVFAAGNGVVMKVDEWTGQSWVRSSELRNGYSTGHFYWQPVRE